jgi:hypothetical protein
MLLASLTLSQPSASGSAAAGPPATWAPGQRVGSGYTLVQALHTDRPLNWLWLAQHDGYADEPDAEQGNRTVVIKARSVWLPTANCRFGRTGKRT